MVESTELQKLKNDYPDFFNKMPSEVIDFALSEKTSEKIADIAIKNGVDNEEQVEGIAKRIAWVLLDRLPSGNLAMTLELGLGLRPETAKKVADEANQFISSSLAQLKSGELVQPKKESPREKITPASVPLNGTTAGKEEKPKRPPSKDVYREKIE